MGKAAPDDTLDTFLDKVATGTRVSVVNGEPANYAAISPLVAYTTTAGDGNGDFTIGNGDVSGRKVTVGAQTGNNASGTGDGDHVAIDDGTNLLLVTTCPTQTITSGNPVDIAAFDIEIRDPA